MRDSHRMKEKYDLSLDNRQIVSLLIGALVVLGSVFVLGVVVGKQLTGPEGGPAAPDLLTALDAKAKERAKVMEEVAEVPPLTFPDILTERRPRRDPAVEKQREEERAAKEKMIAERKAAEEKAAAEREAHAAKVAEQEKTLREQDAAQRAAKEKLLAEQKAVAAKTGIDAPADDAKTRVAVASEPAEVKPAAAAKPVEVAVADTPTPTRTAPKASLNDAFDRAQPKPASPEGTAGEGDFTLQLSASQNPTEAEAFAQRLRSRGYAPYVVSGEVPGRGTFYRVRMGSFPTREAAARYLEDFKRETQMDGFIATR